MDTILDGRGMNLAGATPQDVIGWLMMIQNTAAVEGWTDLSVSGTEYDYNLCVEFRRPATEAEIKQRAERKERFNNKEHLNGPKT